jgi:phosphopentomutase
VRRAFVVVLDACGVGALPDAPSYGDAGSNTLAHLAACEGGLRLPTLERLGLGSILPLEGVAPAPAPVRHGALHALGPGKDSTAGHWELMGVVMDAPAPTYPDGFPERLIAEITRISGLSVICNQPYNGMSAIHDFGAAALHEHALILYTSQDSVLQIAAHEDAVAAERLYEICAAVRGVMSGADAVGRVIARPFRGTAENFVRTDGRRDFGVLPPARSYLQEIQASGVPVHTVGKSGQLFSGVGIDVQHPGATNAAAIAATGELIGSLAHGLVFTNLIETDQVYGHRHDAPGFHAALRDIDAAVGGWLERLGEEDLLILSADHGCDVTAPHTDHTRERVPLLASYAGAGGCHDGPMADVGASVLRWLCDRDAPELPGASFL